jgi:hypothetical protein
VQQVAVKRSLRELEPEVLELIQNELILQPEAAGGTIAHDLWYREANTFAELGRVLSYHYVVRVVASERRQARPRTETAPLFPDIPDVPRRIVTPEGKRPLLARSTATDIRQYVKTLNAKHRDRIAVA